jgi:hypothetical protein
MTARNVLRPLAGALLAALVLAGSAEASGGITPLSPKRGAAVRAGESPTFRMRVKGPGTVWVHVCESKRRDSKGVICKEPGIGQARKKGGVFMYKPRFFDFPEFWLNQPGTYYWQAYRIHCDNGLRDCQQESAITKFSVV